MKGTPCHWLHGDRSIMLLGCVAASGTGNIPKNPPKNLLNVLKFREKLILLQRLCSLLFTSKINKMWNLNRGAKPLVAEVHRLSTGSSVPFLSIAGLITHRRGRFPLLLSADLSACNRATFLKAQQKLSKRNKASGAGESEPFPC